MLCRSRVAPWPRLVALVVMAGMLTPQGGLAASEATPVSTPVGDAPLPVSFPRVDGPHDVAV